MGRTIVISASLAQRPHQAGHAWVFLQYLLGFRKLGWDVLLLDRLEPGMCIDDAAQPCAFHESTNVRYFCDVMRQFDLTDSFSLWYDGAKQVIGRSAEDVLEQIRGAEMFLNVMGFWNDPRTFEAAKRRVFVDIDPGFGQMWCALGLFDLFAGHDAFVTVGHHVGRETCTIPTCGHRWIPILPPIVLDQWPDRPIPPDAPWTSIASWRGDFGPVQYEGRTYGLRVHEFRKFFELPRLANQSFQLALDVHPADAKDVDALEENHWQRIIPRDVAADPDSYRDFIARSFGEFMVAKNMYVQSHSGWFSDRSACYLASGRPVVAQDTGLDHLPTGAGLLTFSTLDEAMQCVNEVKRDPAEHARAARAIAERYFDSDKVLGQLLEQLGIGQEKLLCRA
jgi:hypothetical protein